MRCTQVCHTVSVTNKLPRIAGIMTKLLHKHLFFHNDPSDLKYYLGPGFWDSNILRLHCKLTPWSHWTHDTWHLTCDRWCQLSSFHGLGVMMFWRFGCRRKMLSPDLQKICESNEWFKHLAGIPVSGLLSDTGQPGKDCQVISRLAALLHYLFTHWVYEPRQSDVS